MSGGKTNYKAAGVDIDAGNEAVARIKDGVKTTFKSNVLTGLGSFDRSMILNQSWKLTIIQSWFRALTGLEQKPSLPAN